MRDMTNSGIMNETDYTTRQFNISYVIFDKLNLNADYRYNNR